jgi:hypothetical protein
MLVNTISKRCSSTFRGRRLVLGGLHVHALDRNQSLLPFNFIFIACCSVLFLLPKKGGDPRQVLTVRLFFSSHVLVLRRSCAFPNFVLCPPPMHAHPTSPPIPHCSSQNLLAQHLLVRPLLRDSLPSEVRWLMRCSLYTPLFCPIQHASAHCICLYLSYLMQRHCRTFSCMHFNHQLSLLLLSSLSHPLLALQVTIGSHAVRCTAA